MNAVLSPTWNVSPGKMSDFSSAFAAVPIVIATTNNTEAHFTANTSLASRFLDIE
jgi:hypothetical protein